MKRMSVLAILVLAISITAFSVAGTYAKYTSTETISDSARVAKWNIGSTQSVDLFKDSYVGVDSDDDSKVIAPGTSGSYDFKLTGAVETNYTIKASVTAEETNGLQGRVIYSLKNKTTGEYLPSAEKTTLAGLKTAIETLYDGNTIYAAGNLNEDEYTIEWEWVFEKNTTVDEETVVDAENDTTDTGLGNKAAEGTTVPTVSITVDLTVTQSNRAA